MLVDATRFQEAATQLQGTTVVAYENLPVVPYLLGHVIELGLKAYLCAEGRTHAQLKGLGHNLRACLDAAKAAGLGAVIQVSADDEAAIDLLNEMYWRKELEYATPLPAGGRLVSLPPPAALLALSSRLVSGLRPHCLAANRRMRGSA